MGNVLLIPQNAKSSFHRKHESLLKVVKDRIIKSDYWSKLTIRQKHHLKKPGEIKKMDDFKHPEGTYYKFQKFQN